MRPQNTGYQRKNSFLLRPLDPHILSQIFLDEASGQKGPPNQEDSSLK